jgi:hypothetical protein
MDIATDPCDFRFTPESGHSSARLACPLWANSGLMQRSKKASLGALQDAIYNRSAFC